MVVFFRGFIRMNTLLRLSNMIFLFPFLLFVGSEIRRAYAYIRECTYIVLHLSSLMHSQRSIKNKIKEKRKRKIEDEEEKRVFSQQFIRRFFFFSSSVELFFLSFFRLSFFGKGQKWELVISRPFFCPFGFFCCEKRRTAYLTSGCLFIDGYRNNHLYIYLCLYGC